MQDLNLSMANDFYEFTMSQAYFNEGKTEEIAVFDAFFRKNPFDSGYAIMAGVDKIIETINNFHFTGQDIDFLRQTKAFSEDFLTYLKNFKFHGSIYAIPDGTVIFANEPIVTVKAPIIEAQLIETILLSYLNSHICWATSSKRITEAAKGIGVMEFGLRRAMGPIAGLDASKCAIMAGCIGTSNVLNAKEYNTLPLGTMAHSFITSFDSEYDAFLAYAKTYPNNCTLLVDTYDVIKSGIPNAIKVAKDFLLPNGYTLKGIRIDSGDLAKLAKEARKMLDEAGLTDTKICVSNGLKEDTIRALKEQNAPIDSMGLGDNIVLPDQARVGVVYKNVAIKKEQEYISKIKVSNEEAKAITPGYKKVYRFYDKENGLALGDVIALHNQKIPEDEFTLIDPINNHNQTRIKNYRIRELQIPIFIKGHQVYQDPTLLQKQKLCTQDLQTIPDEVKRYLNPQIYFVDMTKDLITLKRELIKQAKEQGMKLNRIK